MTLNYHFVLYVNIKTLETMFKFANIESPEAQKILAKTEICTQIIV